MKSIGLVDVYLRGAAIGRSIELFAPAQDRESSAQLFLPLDRPAPVRSQLELIDPRNPSHQLDQFHVAHTIEVPTPSTAERRGCWGYLRAPQENAKDQTFKDQTNDTDEEKLDSKATEELPSERRNESSSPNSAELHRADPEYPSQSTESASSSASSRTSSNSEASPPSNDTQPNVSSVSNSAMKIGNSPRSSRRSKKGKRKKLQE